MQDKNSCDKKLSTRFDQDSEYTRFYVSKHSHDASYVIQVKAAPHNVLHVDELGDRCVSTRYQQDSSYTRFVFMEALPPAYFDNSKAYYIQTDASRKYLTEATSYPSKLIKTNICLFRIDEAPEFLK